MDVFKLSPTTWYPTAIVEGYESMIWTERYNVPGEFQMTTYQVDKHLSELKTGWLLGVRGSTTVMSIETQHISDGGDGMPLLTITGRTLDLFLEYRLISGYYNKRHSLGTRPGANRLYSSIEAAELILWNTMINATNEDLVGNPAYTWRYYPDDVFPNSVLTETVDTPTLLEAFDKRRFVSPGVVDPQFRRFLRRERLGLRLIRPDSRWIANRQYSTVTFSTEDTISRGGKSSSGASSTTDTTKLRWDIYNGLDRSVEQTGRTPVVFHFNVGHFESLEYLFSVKEYMKLVHVTSSVNQSDRHSPSNIGPLYHRAMVIDGGEPAEGENHTEFMEDLKDLGDDEIIKRADTAIFNGQISVETPYNFNEHYFLGDKVTLKGDYNQERTLKISEYTRTEDKEGDRGFPSMSVDEL